MEEQTLTSYFKQQAREMLHRSAAEPDGFFAYFAGQAPRDEEILSLLAISVASDRPISGQFPTPFEALAALSRASRSEICIEFRKALKASLAHLPAA